MHLCDCAFVCIFRLHVFVNGTVCLCVVLVVINSVYITGKAVSERGLSGVSQTVVRNLVC